MNTTAPTLDLAAIKARQQETWSTGDFAVVAARIAWRLRSPSLRRRRGVGGGFVESVTVG